MSTSTTRWSSRTAFIFAASAAAIGLGNIWRFPYMVGQNGGGIFVLVYLACVIILGVPLLIAEIVLGRIGRQNPVSAFINVARNSQRSQWWGIVGGINILAAFLILTYYVVIIGWVLDYLIRAVSGQFVNATEASSLLEFHNLQASHWQMLLTTTAVVTSTMAVIILGIKSGLERAVMIMFPALLVLLCLLLTYSFTTSGFHIGLTFLFKPDWHALTIQTVLLALGQAFFSLNIGMAVTIMFSAFLPKTTPITSSAIAITLADTGFAIISGLIIFPIVFSNDLQASAGPSLIFQTLPIAFGHMPFGSIIGSLFFLLLFFAAFTSAIALLEPPVSWLIENHNCSRTRAVLLSGGACWLLSLGTIASFSFGKHLTIFGLTFYNLLDILTASIMLPLGGLFIAIFTGWCLKQELLTEHLQWPLNHFWIKAWRWALRYFAPIAIAIILLASFKLI